MSPRARRPQVQSVDQALRPTASRSRACAKKTGVLACIAERPRRASARRRRRGPFGAAPSGIPGANLFLPLWLGLVDEGVLDIDQARRARCAGPARLHRLDDRAASASRARDLVLIRTKDWTVQEEGVRVEAKLSPYVLPDFRGGLRRVWVGGSSFDRAQPRTSRARARCTAPAEGVRRGGGRRASRVRICRCC